MQNILNFVPEWHLVCVCCSADGEFGAFMQVHIQNDGPVTLLLESPQLPPPKQVRLQDLLSTVY